MFARSTDLRRWDHHGDPPGDGPLPDITSGIMWLLAAVAGLGTLALPGATRTHLPWAIALALFALGWGALSLLLGIKRRTMPISLRAIVTAGMMPVVGVALWATGGADSQLQPILLFTALFIAYFFPPKLAWPLVGLFAATYATPLLYDASAVADGYPSRAAVFLVAVAGETVVMQVLKRRLLHAEARQRVMAQHDPLTGLQNRRSFDAALARHAGQSGALIVFDFDDFKTINDVHGHPAGDAVLQAVAEACRGVARDGDCLARIGGDEFALIAPGAGEQGVERLVGALDQGIIDAALPQGISAVRASFAWALTPEEASAPSELFELADQRLLERKRDSKAAPAVGAGAH
jgi:diguanylate cyclase (GGDEF)-like protein